MNFLTSLCSQLNPYDVLAWALVLTVIFVFWKWHLNPNNKFDLMDLVCEQDKLSSSKFMRTGSWAVMSYGFYLLAKTSPESLVGYAPLYGGIWVSARALDKFQQNNTVNLSGATTHTTTESTVEEHKLLEFVSLTPEQVNQAKQSFYSDK
jgi:hypothetical protein